MAARLNRITSRSRSVRNEVRDENWDNGGIRMVFYTSEALALDDRELVEADAIKADHDGLLHREYGPAIIETYGDGSLYSYGYYRDGREHREDGPAFYNCWKVRYWMIEGRRHRMDGPAVECEDGTAEWWLHGYRFTVSEWERFRDLNEQELICHPEVEDWIVLGARARGDAPGFYSREQREIEERFYDQVAGAVASDPVAQASDPLSFA